MEESLEIATIRMRDRDSGCEAIVIVRVIGSTIDLTVSLMSDGDVEIFVVPEDAAQIVSALQTAVTARNVPLHDRERAKGSFSRCDIDSGP